MKIRVVFFEVRVFLFVVNFESLRQQTSIQTGFVAVIKRISVNMLVLGRKVNEKIQIGDNIVVTVLEVEEGNVKIGIDAPKNIGIFRMELLEQVQKENIESASKEMGEITEAAELIKNKFSM